MHNDYVLRAVCISAFIMKFILKFISNVYTIMYFYVYCMFVNTISNNISRSSRECSALDSHQEFIFFHRDFIFRFNTRPMDWKEV